MSAAYYDLYAEEDALFVAKLNILTPEGTTARLYNSVGQIYDLYIPPELKTIGVTGITAITPTFIIVPTNSLGKLSIDISSGVLLSADIGDHNVVVQKIIPPPGVSSIFDSNTSYLYEFNLLFTTNATPPVTHKLRILQGKFNINKSIQEYRSS